MSQFSGKCDLYDCLNIMGKGDINLGFEKIKKGKIYVGYENFNQNNKLKLETLKDIIPYYPYIEIISAWDNINETGTIILSDKSWVDIEAKKYGELSMHKYYRKILKQEIENYS